MISPERVAVITGGSRGLGLAHAHALGLRGYKLVISARAGLDPALRGLKEAGLEAVGVAADLATSAGSKRLAATALDAYGRIDALVCNAGGSRPFAKRLLETGDDQWEGMLNANLASTFYSIRELAPHLIETQGTIVTTSSVHALSGGRLGLGVYATAKAGVIALSKAAARELGPRGVIVFSIAPGVVDTENLRAGMGEMVDELGAQTPIGRPSRPEEIASVVAALIESRSPSLNGAVIELSGGKGDFYVPPRD